MAAWKGRPLKSVAALDQLTLGNDFILRIAEERSRQAVERAETLATLLAQAHAENEALRAGVGIASGVETRELRTRVAELEADAARQKRELAAAAASNKDSVPSGQLEKVTGELQAAKAAAQLAATAAQVAEALSSERAEALSSERAEVTAQRARIVHLEADLVAKERELAEVMAFNDVATGDTVPLDRHEKAVAELAAERAAREASASALEQANESLSFAQAGASELQGRVAQLDANAAGEEQQLADVIAFNEDSVPSDEHEAVVAELQGELEAHIVAATALQVAEQALSTEQAKATALRSQLAAEKAAVDQAAEDAIAAEEATAAVAAQLEDAENAAAKAARAAEGEAADLQSRLAAAQQASGNTGQQASALLEENLSLRGELREVVEQNEASAQEVQVAMAEAARISLELGDVTAACDALVSEHAQTEEAHSAVSQELELLRVTAQAAEASYEDLLSARISDIEAKVAEIAQLEQVLKAKDDEVGLIMEFGADGALVPMDEHEEIVGGLKQQVADEQAKAAMGASEREAESTREVAALKEAAVLAAMEAQDMERKLTKVRASREDSAAQLEQTKEELADAQKKLARRAKARASGDLEPESEVVMSPVEMKGLAAGMRAFCLEQADDYIAAALGRLVQLGATATEGVFVSTEATCRDLDCVLKLLSDGLITFAACPWRWGGVHRARTGERFPSIFTPVHSTFTQFPFNCQELNETQELAKQDGGRVKYGDLRLGFASCTDVFAVATVTGRWLRTRNDEEPWIPLAMRGHMRELGEEGAAYLAQIDASNVGDDAEADAAAGGEAADFDFEQGFGIARTKQLTHEVCSFVGSLPPRSETVVGPLLCFLRAVDDRASETRMSASNLATVLAPSFISQSSLEPEEAAQAMSADIAFCTLLIRLYEPPAPAPWIVLAKASSSESSDPPLQLAAAEAGWTAQRIEMAQEIRELRDQLGGGARRESTASIASSHHSSVALSEGVPGDDKSKWGNVRAGQALARPAAPAASPSGGFNVLLRAATTEDLTAAGMDSKATMYLLRGKYMLQFINLPLFLGLFCDVYNGRSRYYMELWKDGSKLTGSLRRYSEFDSLRKRCA